MKRVLLLLIAVYCLSLTTYAQKPHSLKKSPHIGVSIGLKDYVTAKRLMSESLGRLLGNDQLAKISEMQLGFGFNYMNGLSNHIDFIATLNGATVYPSTGQTVDAKKRLLLDLTTRLNYKFLTDKYTVVPYITIGVGASMYNFSAFAATIPMGGGLQFNLGKKNSFIFLQSLYNLPVNPSGAGHNFTYSLGGAFPLRCKVK